jgi:Bardet-Biedl syndrome 1 protein
MLGRGDHQHSGGATLQRSTFSLQTRTASGGGDPLRPLWLDAWSDPVAGLSAFSGCMHTCNLFGDGDWRLVVADADKKLKVGWRGTA